MLFPLSLNVSATGGRSMRVSALMLLGLTAALLIATTGEAVAGFDLSGTSETPESLISSDCDDCDDDVDDSNPDEDEEEETTEETEETE